MIINATMTQANSGIQMYTDNTASDANPKYTGVPSVTPPSGLIGTSTTTAVLPMCWRIVTISTTSLTIVQGGPSNNLFASELGGYNGGNGYPCFLYMLDKSSMTTTASGQADNNGDYAEIWDQALGLQSAAGTGSSGFTGPTGQAWAYVYFGANFASAISPNTYRTTTLRLEAFHD